MPSPNIGIVALGCVVILCAGCSTKNYGRQPELTSFEKQTMTCREIDLEQAKVEGFLQHITEESQFDGRSILSFMGDFGIGNAMEKASAEDSANQRLAQLRYTRTNQGCSDSLASQPATNAHPQPTRAAMSPGDTVERQLYELRQQKGLSYDEYQQRYKEITFGH